MKWGSLRDRASAMELIARVRRTENVFERAAGLLALPKLAPDEGLLIERCASIHTCFMRYEIDVVFLDKTLTIQKLVEVLPPWRARACTSASMTLEVDAGLIDRAALRVGQQLSWVAW